MRKPLVDCLNQIDCSSGHRTLDAGSQNCINHNGGVQSMVGEATQHRTSGCRQGTPGLSRVTAQRVLPKTFNHGQLFTGPVLEQLSCDDKPVTAVVAFSADNCNPLPIERSKGSAKKLDDGDTGILH